MLVEVGAVVGGRGRPSRRSGCRASSSAGTSSLANTAACAVDELVDPVADRAELVDEVEAVGRWWCAGRPRAAPSGRRPAPRRTRRGCSLKMARNFARSSSGTVGVLGEGEHPGVEVEPRELAVEERARTRTGPGGCTSRASAPTATVRARPPANATARSSGDRPAGPHFGATEGAGVSSGTRR